MGIAWNLGRSTGSILATTFHLLLSTVKFVRKTSFLGWFIPRILSRLYPQSSVGYVGLLHLQLGWTNLLSRMNHEVRIIVDWQGYKIWVFWHPIEISVAFVPHLDRCQHILRIWALLWWGRSPMANWAIGTSPWKTWTFTQNWLVVWNILYVSIQLGIIIPTDFHICQRGWNHQPEKNVGNYSSKTGVQLWRVPSGNLSQRKCFTYGWLFAILVDFL